MTTSALLMRVCRTYELDPKVVETRAFDLLSTQHRPQSSTTQPLHSPYTALTRMACTAPTYKRSMAAHAALMRTKAHIATRGEAEASPQVKVCAPCRAPDIVADARWLTDVLRVHFQRHNFDVHVLDRHLRAHGRAVH